MTIIHELIEAALFLLPSGAGARAVYCLIKMAMDEEQHGLYKRRLTNLLIFTVVAESIVGLLYTILGYIT